MNEIETFKRYCHAHKDWANSFGGDKEELVNDYMWRNNIYGNEIFEQLVNTEI